MKNKKIEELEERLVNVARVTTVRKGGRIFKFSVLVIVGDGKGRVGYGLGKAKEVSQARQKAVQEAKRNIKRYPLRESRTPHHDVVAHYRSAKVVVRHAPAGTGIIAGGAMRSVFEALGVKDVVAKSIGSASKHNVVKATIKALESMKSPKIIAINRSKKIGDIIVRRNIVNKK